MKYARGRNMLSSRTVIDLSYDLVGNIMFI